MQIFMDDLKRSGICAKGAKGWFREHDLDFREFLKNGIPEEQLTETGDAMAKRVVDSAKDRRNG